jgi:hypothetical protein
MIFRSSVGGFACGEASGKGKDVICLSGTAQLVSLRLQRNLQGTDDDVGQILARQVGQF